MTLFNGLRTTAGLTVAPNAAKPHEQIIAVGVVPENLPALDAANDGVMQRARGI
jgi:hypothetical protein